MHCGVTKRGLKSHKVNVHFRVKIGIGWYLIYPEPDLQSQSCSGALVDGILWSHFIPLHCWWKPHMNPSQHNDWQDQAYFFDTYFLENCVLYDYICRTCAIIPAMTTLLRFCFVKNLLTILIVIDFTWQILKMIMFRYRESNPGLLGESQLS